MQSRETPKIDKIELSIKLTQNLLMSDIEWDISKIKNLTIQDWQKYLEQHYSYKALSQLNADDMDLLNRAIKGNLLQEA